MSERPAPVDPERVGDWRKKAISEIDAALTEWATRRDEMNVDGLMAERLVVVDEMLDQRTRLVAQIAADPR